LPTAGLVRSAARTTADPCRIVDAVDPYRMKQGAAGGQAVAEDVSGSQKFLCARVQQVPLQKVPLAVVQRVVPTVVEVPLLQALFAASVRRLGLPQVSDESHPAQTYIYIYRSPILLIIPI